MTHGFLGTIGWIKGNLMSSSQASEKGYNNDNFYPGAPNIPDSEPKYGINDYIKDESMVLWADGIYNQGINKPHSNSTNTWIDLSGKKNGLFRSSSSQPKWEDNCAVFSGAYEIYEFFSVPLGSWTPTIEVVFSVRDFVNEDTHNSMYVISNSEGGGGIISVIKTTKTMGSVLYANKTYSYLTDTPAEAGKIYSLVMTYDGYNQINYLNGVEIARKQLNTTATIGYLVPLTLGSDAVQEGNNNSVNHFNGKIFAARVYTRPLSSEEILHNYKVDKARFSIN